MSITELHNRAMELADLGDISKMKRQPDEALRLYNEAFELERSAALGAKQDNLGEPSISVLLRSAASLALCCKRLREAEQLIALGLSGEPPHEIAEELRNLLETVNFERHLEINGVSLQDSEVQLVVAGSGVGYGFAKGEDVLSRVDKFTNLTIRTIERKMNLPFRKSGPLPIRVKKLSETYLSTPRAASFAVTLRFGALPDGQMSLPGMPSPYGNIIEDIAKNITLINEGKTEELEQNFEDKTYLNNFISLTKELAPDGKDVSIFGITYKKEENTIPIQLTRTKEEFKTFPEFEVSADPLNPSKSKVDTIKGVLSVADGLKGHVKINKSKSQNILITVPDGMADIVKTYWEEEVVVTYREVNGKKSLMSIDRPKD